MGHPRVVEGRAAIACPFHYHQPHIEDAAWSTVTLHTITAELTESASLERKYAIATASLPLLYAKDFSVELAPYSVVVVSIQTE